MRYINPIIIIIYDFMLKWSHVQQDYRNSHIKLISSLLENFCKFWVLPIVASQMQYFPDASWEKFDIQNPRCTNITYEHMLLLKLSV